MVNSLDMVYLRRISRLWRAGIPMIAATPLNWHDVKIVTTGRRGAPTASDKTIFSNALSHISMEFTAPLLLKTIDILVK